MYVYAYQTTLIGLMLLMDKIRIETHSSGLEYVGLGNFNSTSESYGFNSILFLLVWRFLCFFIKCKFSSLLVNIILRSCQYYKLREIKFSSVQRIGILINPFHYSNCNWEYPYRTCSVSVPLMLRQSLEIYFITGRWNVYAVMKCKENLVHSLCGYEPVS